MKKARKWIIPLGIVVLLGAALLLYAGDYYRADETALAALQSDPAVTVTRAGYGWFFDGPSQEDLLVFYPGGKVEETAYAPLLHRLAEQGMDVCLLEVPFRLAVLDGDKADEAFALYSYANCYVGGHSLGGVIAAGYAASHGDTVSGVILLGAYPTKAMPDDLLLLSICGSEDKVVNRAKIAEGRLLAPRRYFEYSIEGGNHAQFGNYGTQKGDGSARITADLQQQQTVQLILQSIRNP